MAVENRDRARRRASKRAYYERHKERLRERARERAAAARQDPAAREARQLVLKRYKEKYAVNLRMNRLNLRRRIFIQQCGVEDFRKHFHPRLSPEQRANIPHGYLLEDHDDDVLEAIFMYFDGPR